MKGQLLTAQEVAKLLSMSVIAVRRAGQRGTLKVVRIGRRVRFPLSKLPGQGE